jgi:predicted lipid-binding transport protein (Tim44 family)
MSEAFDIYTLLFLVLAVVIFIRLRNVLGRRTGNERQPFDPYSAPDQKRPGGPKTNEPVVALPRGRGAPLPETSVPSRQPRAQGQPLGPLADAADARRSEL